MSYYSSLPITLESETIERRGSVASISVKTNDLVDLSNFEEPPPPEFAKEEPEIWMKIFSYSVLEDVTTWQGVANKFYYNIIPH